MDTEVVTSFFFFLYDTVDTCRIKKQNIQDYVCSCAHSTFLLCCSCHLVATRGSSQP